MTNMTGGGSMRKNQNNINDLIKEAINASIEFDALMDRIDFNSYLPNDDKNIKPNSPDYQKYKNYKNLVDQVEKLCDDVISSLSEELVLKIKEKENNGNPFIPYPTKKIDMTQCLVFQLFETKKTRLEGRKHLRKEEIRKYIESAHRLHQAFDCIPKTEFYDTSRKRFLFNNYNWAKVLYYNEMSICYSGLAESSMSLGYAEAAILILKEIKKNENSDDKNILKLETFALCNKGEAERNLHDNSKALLTFNEIIKICKGNENEFPDYYQALFRTALILIDQGRGKQAIDLMNKMEVLDDDARYSIRDLEIASAYIDQKNFEEARNKLDIKKDITYASRKASLYKIRCLLEWRKNKPTELNKQWEKEYNNIPKEIKGKNVNIIEGIIKECIKRKDGVNFKKACRYFSEFHELEKKYNKKKSPEKSIELELWGHFLYLFYEKLYMINKLIKLKDIEKQLQGDNYKLIKIIDKIEDTEYMEDFFYCSIDYFKCIQNKLIREVIDILYKRLTCLYREKDYLYKYSDVEEKYGLFNELHGNSKEEDIKKKENKNNDENGAVNFVQKCFFEGRPFEVDKKRIFLLSDSILTKMEKSTLDFAEKIIEKTKRFSKDEEFKAVLTVLRRWNSFTPALESCVNPSKGGGYFLYVKYKNSTYGIVIDPGYDYLENFFSQGYRIGDIDAIIISHAHPDHTDNLPAILSLFHELNGRLGEYYYSNRFKKEKFNKKHLKLIVSQGVFDQYYKLIKPAEKFIKDIIVVQPNEDKCNGTYLVKEFDKICSIEIESFTTLHRDLSQWESMGFIMDIKYNGIIRKIGYTSDAHWTPDFSNKFFDCQILCTHLGSIVDISSKKGFCVLCQNYYEIESGKCKDHSICEKGRFKNGKPCIETLLKQAREKNHLYISGLSMLFNEILSKNKGINNKMELAIISEFGEELKSGIRMDLYNKFDNWFETYNSKLRCLPGDIGLEVDVFSGSVYCHGCKHFVDRSEIEPVPYGKEEAICFVCKECKAVLSSYQIDHKLKEYCENGRKLELAD